MHAWQPIPSARLHARLPQDSMVIVAGVTCTIAIFDFEKLVREALTLQVVCMLAGMRMMLPPAMGEHIWKGQP